MAEIVNLRRIRKTRLRAQSEAEAAANRITHGRTRTERAASPTEIRRQAAILDNAKLDGDREPRE